MKLKTDKLFRTSVQAVTALLVFASRWLAIAPNFTPLGAFGFYGQNLSLFMINIIVFDWFKSGFYPGFIFTYLGFMGYFVLGKIAASQNAKRRSSQLWLNLGLMTAASFWFFIISNFGVWLYWYPHTWQGLLSCYLAALPFYRNTLLSDAFFSSGVMLGQLAIHLLRKQKHYRAQATANYS